MQTKQENHNKDGNHPKEWSSLHQNVLFSASLRVLNFCPKGFKSTFENHGPLTTFEVKGDEEP